MVLSTVRKCDLCGFNEELTNGANAPGWQSLANAPGWQSLGIGLTPESLRVCGECESVIRETTEIDICSNCWRLLFKPTNFVNHTPVSVITGLLRGRMADQKQHERKKVVSAKRDKT